jgi:CheY-like chemotaxis protein
MVRTNFNEDIFVELNANVLVMDDEPLVRLLICSGLERAGAVVTEAESCSEAIRLTQNTEFDVVILDYRLPDGNGLDVAIRLRDDGFRCPVIMLSGEALDIEQDALEKAGVFAVLPKPPDLKKIVESVGQAMGQAPTVDMIRVGRYAYCKMDSEHMSVPSEWASKDCLAVDFSDVRSTSLPSDVLECVCRSRASTALVGVNKELHQVLESVGGNFEFVSDVDELAALSRRPTSPSERSALMRAIIQGEQP